MRILSCFDRDSIITDFYWFTALLYTLCILSNDKIRDLSKLIHSERARNVVKWAFRFAMRTRSQYIHGPFNPDVGMSSLGLHCMLFLFKRNFMSTFFMYTMKAISVLLSTAFFTFGLWLNIKFSKVFLLNFKLLYIMYVLYKSYILNELCMKSHIFIIVHYVIRCSLCLRMLSN